MNRSKTEEVVFIILVKEKNIANGDRLGVRCPPSAEVALISFDIVKRVNDFQCLSCPPRQSFPRITSLEWFLLTGQIFLRKSACFLLASSTLF